ncbi:MAG: hypothetical protein IJ880_08500 [Bacilli bacterium]|nr:hypothetical protein [Bacilli bacterium]
MVVTNVVSVACAVHPRAPIEVLLRILLVVTAPVPFPINAAPLVKVVAPVPPLDTPNVPVTGIASCAALPSKVTAVVESNLVFKLRAV